MKLLQAPVVIEHAPSKAAFILAVTGFSISRRLPPGMTAGSRGAIFLLVHFGPRMIK